MQYGAKTLLDRVVHFLSAVKLVQHQHTLGAAGPSALVAALIYSFTQTGNEFRTDAPDLALQASNPSSAVFTLPSPQKYSGAIYVRLMVLLLGYRGGYSGSELWNTNDVRYTV